MRKHPRKPAPEETTAREWVRLLLSKDAEQRRRTREAMAAEALAQTRV